MTQRPNEPVIHRHVPGRNQLLQRHPVLTPVILLCSAVALGIAGIYGNAVFPVLPLARVAIDTFVLLCIIVAFVLGIAGVLATIIGILEQVDRSFTGVSFLMFLRLKERTYANRN
jgi:hypothetical protein